MASDGNIADFLRFNKINNEEPQGNQHWHGGTGKNPIGWLNTMNRGAPSPPPQEENNVIDMFRRSSQAVAEEGRVIKRLGSFGQQNTSAATATPPQTSSPSTMPRWGNAVPGFQPIQEAKLQPPPPTPPQDLVEMVPPPPPPIDSPPPPPPFPPPPPEDPPVSPQAPAVVVPAPVPAPVATTPPVVAPIPPVEPASPSTLTLAAAKCAVQLLQEARVEQLPVAEGKAVITSSGVKGTVEDISGAICVIKSTDGYYLERPVTDVRPALLVVINAAQGGFLTASPPLLPFLSSSFYVVTVGDAIVPTSGSCTTIPDTSLDALEAAWAAHPGWDATNSLLLQDRSCAHFPSNTLIVPPRLGPKRDAENSKALQKMLERLIASETDVRSFYDDHVTGEWAKGMWKIPASVPPYPEPVKVVQKEAVDLRKPLVMESVVPSKVAIQSMLSHIGMVLRKTASRAEKSGKEKKERKKGLVAVCSVPNQGLSAAKGEITSWTEDTQNAENSEAREWWPSDEKSLTNRPDPPPAVITTSASPGRGGKTHGGPRKSAPRRGGRGRN